MSIFKLGSKGEEVRRIQQRLQTLGIYSGPLDGVFGGGTQAAVGVFQSREKLESDGIVGNKTWKALFKEKITSSAISCKSLDYRCLAITGSFETGRDIPDCFAGLAGDYDGQGLSFGVLQWNLGQGTLQPLLKRFCTDHEEIGRSLFHHNFNQLTSMLGSGKLEQIGFALAIQDPLRKTVNEPWRGMFKALGRTEEFQRIQLKSANAIYKSSRKLCDDYGLWSERAVALMFDIKTQNGSIGSTVKAAIMKDFQGISGKLSAEEQELARLQIIANRRAEAAKPRFVEDVRARKLCIANGVGTVHGISYDLDEQFGVGLRRYDG